MATGGNSREVKLSLSVETLGEDGLKQLQSSIAALGKAGGDSAPKFAALADEIGRLGEQNKALTSFQALSETATELAARENQVAQSFGAVKTELNAAEAATKAATERQQQLKDALDLAKSSLAQTNGELTILRNSYDENGKRVANYASDLKGLIEKKVAEKKALEDARAALADANSEVSKAETAQSKLETAYTRTAKEVEASQKAVELNATAMKTARDATEAYGLSTDDVAASQAKLISAINSVGSEADALRAQIAALQRQEEELAATDAFNKQLQEAEKLRKAGEYAQFWATALDEAEAAQRSAAAAASDAQWQKQADELVNAAEAARKLATETEQLVAAQREVAAQKAFAQQAEEAAKLRQAAEYVRFWTDELNKMDEAAKVATDATAKINTAFGVVGVRGVQALQAEIAQVREAMETLRTQSGLTGSALATAMASGQAKINALEQEIRQVTGALTTADKAANLFKNSMGQITAGNVIADGVGYLVNKVKEAGTAFVTSLTQLESFRRALNAIYKDSNTTASQLDFLRATATKAGVSVGGISDSFIKFAAATKSANIPISQTNELFQNLTVAGGTLGLSSERVSLAIDALGQMASKGVVSMEELRQQLGDALPGAFSLVAQGLGRTDAELVKLVESGGLLARDLFPALSKALKQLGGEVDGLQPSFERFKNSLTLIAQGIGDAGGTAILTGALKVLGGTLGTVGLGISAVVDGILTLVKVTATAAAGLTTLTNPLSAIRDLFGEMTNRLTGQANALNTFIDGTEASTEAIGQQSAAASGSVAAINALNTSLGAATTGATASAAGWLSAATSLKELVTDGDKAIIVYEKLVKAAEESGKAIEAWTKIGGNEAEILAANTTAAEANLVAKNALLAVEQNQVGGIQAYIDKLKEELKLLGDPDGSRQKAIDENQKLLDARAAEAQRTKESVDALRAEVAVRQLAAQALQDNTSRYGEYSRAVEVARARVAELTTANQQGKASEDELRAAKEELYKAQNRLNDAVRDAVALAQAQSEKLNSQIGLDKAALELKMAQAKAAEAKAIYDKNEYAQLTAKIAQKDIEIQQIKLNVAAMRAEADAMDVILNKRVEELVLAGKWTDAIATEITARRLEAETKRASATAAEQDIAAKERELKLLRESSGLRTADTTTTTANTTARYANTTAIESQSDAMEMLMTKYTLSANYSQRQIQLLQQEQAQVEALAEAERKRLNVDKNGLSTDKSGNAISAGGDLTSLTGVYNFLKSAGVTDEATAKAIAKEFADAQGNIIYSNNPGQLKYGGSGSTISSALLKAAERYTFGMGAQGTATVGGASVAGNTTSTTSTSTSTGTAAATTSASTTQTINVVINGKANTVSVASAADAATLTDILKQLEAAAGTAA